MKRNFLLKRLANRSLTGHGPSHDCTVVQRVVKATSQSKGKWPNFDPRPGSKTSGWFSVTLGVYNYVASTTTHAIPYGAATTWVVSANT